MSTATRRLTQDQVNEAIDRARERETPKPRTITSGYQMEKAVPTWSRWRMKRYPEEITLVNATFVVSTLDGPLWVVQHKTRLGTMRDEADVFVDVWAREFGDPEKPLRQKAPASMSIGERLKSAQTAVASVGSQLLGRHVDVPADPATAAVVMRAKRMWLVVELARRAMASRSPEDFEKLAAALADLDTGER